MLDLQHFLLKFVHFTESAAGLVAIIMFKKFKKSYWKWFIYYIVYIAISELAVEFILRHHQSIRTYYYDFFGIPLEFIFLFWLYSYKSLDRKKLFWICSGIYLLSLFPYFLFEGSNIVNSFNYITGTFLLSIMIILEFNKQIKTDDILKFRENMMFYINTGVCLLYVGTLPFFAFHSLIWKDKVIWNNYYILFLIANILMYTLFSIALLWGKPNTYSSQ